MTPEDILRQSDVPLRAWPSFYNEAARLLASQRLADTLRTNRLKVSQGSKSFAQAPYDETGNIMLYRQGLSPQRLIRNPYPYDKVYIDDSPVLQGLAARQTTMQRAIQVVKRVAQSMGVTDNG